MKFDHIHHTQMCKTEPLPTKTKLNKGCVVLINQDIKHQCMEATQDNMSWAMFLASVAMPARPLFAKPAQ